MILFVNPRATRPANRRFPLSVMAVGAALPEGTEWEIVDGNLPGIDTLAELEGRIRARAGTRGEVRAVAFTVMPGPQLVSAVPLSRALRARFPELPIVWGGNFPSLYPAPVLAAPYVDWAVRGQGEHTFRELLEVLDGMRDPRTVSGLAFPAPDGTPWTAPEREWVGPDDLPPPPYRRIPVGEYLHPTVLGRRSGVYQASIGCPYGCSFCGVISVYGSRETQESPARTAEHLAFLARGHGMDSVHFYDNNFVLAEAHTRELAERMLPLGLRWWCEARVDALLRLSDDSWRLLRRAGLSMVFCGAESGSDEVLRRMNKKTTTAQVLEVAARTREHGIVPEFSFVFGDPEDAEGEIERTLAFIRRLKGVNPEMELITYFYTPTPQRRGTYGGVDPLSGTPETLEEWTEPAWVAWMTHEDPRVPWLPRRLKARVEDFEVVLKSRFPSLHDRRTRGWGKALGRLLARRRWEREEYADPRALRAVRRWARRDPDDRQAYGHLRAMTLPAREGYRLWAVTYGPETAVSLLESRLVEEMGPDPAGRRLLDAGCGTARRLRAAGAALAAGADLAPEMLAAAPDPAGLAAADLRALPFRDAVFDLVWCRLVLGHLPEVEGAYRELARVCRAGGAVVVTDFHPDAAAAGHRRTFRDADGRLREVEHHPHPPARHGAAAAAAGLVPTSRRDGRVDAALRPFYLRAGRGEAYAAQRGLAIVLALAYRRA